MTRREGPHKHCKTPQLQGVTPPCLHRAPQQPGCAALLRARPQAAAWPRQLPPARARARLPHLQRSAPPRPAGAKQPRMFLHVPAEWPARQNTRCLVRNKAANEVGQYPRIVYCLSQHAHFLFGPESANSAPLHDFPGQALAAAHAHALHEITAHLSRGTCAAAAWSCAASSSASSSSSLSSQSSASSSSV